MAEQERRPAGGTDPGGGTDPSDYRPAETGETPASQAPPPSATEALLARLKEEHRVIVSPPGQ